MSLVFNVILWGFTFPAITKVSYLDSVQVARLRFAMVAVFFGGFTIALGDVSHPIERPPESLGTAVFPSTMCLDGARRPPFSAGVEHKGWPGK